MIVDGMDFDNPDIDKIGIWPMAHNLSNLCRFHGQVTEFYSVAEHCVHIADMIMKDHDDPVLALAGLLHDGTEFITGDIITPIKIFLPKGFDLLLEKVIFKKFDLDPNLMDKVKYYDEQAFLFEVATIYIKDDDSDLNGVNPERHFLIHHWTPTEAKAIFLERFSSLQEMIHNGKQDSFTG